MELQTILIIVSSAALVLLVILIIYRSRVKTEERQWSLERDRLNGELEQQRAKHLELEAELKDINQKRELVEKEVVRLEISVTNLKQKIREDKENSELLQQKFENLANKILDEKSRKFDHQHKEGLKAILDPLREKIKSFEERVDKTNKEGLERHSALREQIRALQTLNQRMTEETSNLTRALKGDSKTQGSWGELVLENILEKSGLRKDHEYQMQASFRGEDGKQMRPDVIIHLPDNKKLIIDSKVSLTAYEQMVNAMEEEAGKTFLKAHILSLQTHYKGLANKNYQDIYRMESPDFVLMFIPIETAFSVAIKENPKLYNDAFDRNVVIVTPSTLLATLKTVDTLWQHEKQNRYAIQIADEAGKMLDKFVNFAESLDKVERHLQQTGEALGKAKNQLSTGRGNLVTRARKLKTLGAKAKKQLPDNWDSTEEE